MLKVSPNEFADALRHAWDHTRHRPLFGWGPPGAAKTAVVRQFADSVGVPLVDFRLGQLTPSDLKGMPVIDHDAGVTRYYPPAQLPRENGAGGILLLDELVQAPPVMQGIAQELLLARRLAEYRLPEQWLVIGLGNRKEDRASVFEMPAQVENRFRHYVIEPTLEDWTRWAYRSGEIHEHVIAFLSYRPNLLHKPDRNTRAWPSPRSWHMASEDYTHGHSVVPSVGEGPGLEFEAFVRTYQNLPDLNRILDGDGETLTAPHEQSALYALATGLALRSEEPEHFRHAFSWLHERSNDEWVQLFLNIGLARAEELGRQGTFARAFARTDSAKRFLRNTRAA